MKMKSTTLLLTLFLCSVVLADEKEESAQRIAQAWLIRIDAGEYSRSWEEASRLFKGSVQRNDWVDTLKKHRAPLGKVISRRIEQAFYRNELPGAPRGDYVVIRISTRFEHREMAAETITPVLEDGEWRVADYSVW